MSELFISWCPIVEKGAVYEPMMEMGVRRAEASYRIDQLFYQIVVRVMILLKTFRDAIKMKLRKKK